MVQEIITAFRARFKFNLSNERLRKQAEKWASEIKEGEDVYAFIEKQDIEHLIEFARMDDALRAKPKPEEPTPTIETDKSELDAIKQQVADLKTALEEKNKSDLGKTRNEKLNSIPEHLKTALKYVNLKDLSEDEFSDLEKDLVAQKEEFELNKSKTTPSFSGTKTTGGITPEKASQIAKKI